MSLPMRWESQQEESPAAPPMRTHRPLRRREARRAKMMRAGVGLIAVLAVCGLAGVGAARVSGSARGTEDLKPVTSAAGPLALGKTSVERRLGFVTVTGSATNCLARPLHQVEAVVELLDAHKQTVQVESALVAFGNVPARDTTPFRVELNDNARAVAYRVRFKPLFGGSFD